MVPFRNGAVCELVNEYVHNFICVTIQTQCYVGTLVHVVTDCPGHSFKACDGNGTYENTKFFIVCLLEVVTKNLVSLFHLLKFTGFSCLKEYENIDEDQHNKRYHLLYTKINLLYNSEMGFPQSPSQSCNLNPNSSKCVIKRSL